jgi:AhpD family alkylhydroperoxidase
MQSSREEQMIFSEADVCAKSPLARSFIERREHLNGELLASDNKLIKRFFNLDTNAYLHSEGLPVLVKELMGLSVSAAMRCESCIYYHLIQAFRYGSTRKQIEESLNISLVIAGSIVIPSLRNAFAMLNELMPPQES